VSELKQRTFNQVACLIFLAVAIFHVLRIFLGWDVNIGGWEPPMWLSGVGAVVAGLLAWSAYKLTK
jgi:hypothetical protein